MIEQDLQGLGLTEGESKAYLAMLELGASTVGPIAKKSGISYSKIYEVLQRLIEKGIASFIIKAKTKHFQAISPELLDKFLDRQEAVIEENRLRLKNIIPELKKHTKSSEEKQEAEIFVGLKGLRTASEKMYADFKKGEESLFFYVYKKEYSKLVDEFYYKLAPFYKKTGIKFKGLASEEWARSEYAKTTAPFIDSRYVNFPLPGTIDIYKDMILEIAWSENPIGILIHSKEIAENYRVYFNEVWKVAKK